MLHKLFNYNRQANDWFISVFEQNPIAENLSDAHKLFSHIFNAHAIWLARIKGEPMPYGVWDIHPIGRYAQLNTRLHDDTLKVLAYFPLDAEVPYQNSLGNSYTHEVGEALFHVINHGTHHRAQVAQLFSKSSIKPPVSDYIFYLRK